MADNVFWRVYAKAAGGPGGPVGIAVEPPFQTGALELGARAVIGPFGRDAKFLFVSSAVAGYAEFGGANVAAALSSRPLVAKENVPAEGGQWFGVMPGTYASLWYGTTADP